MFSIASISSFERGDRGPSKDVSSRTSHADPEEIATRNLSLKKKSSDDKENQEFRVRFEKQPDEVSQGGYSHKNLSKINSREQLINSSEKSSLTTTPNPGANKLWKLKQNNIDKKFDGSEPGNKSIRFSHAHTESSNTPRSSSSVDPLNEFSYEECKTMLKEVELTVLSYANRHITKLGKIFGVTDPSHVVSCAIKTEKIIKTVTAFCAFVLLKLK